MENKKILPVKIIHLILLVASLTLSMISLVKTRWTTDVINIAKLVTFIGGIVALILGIVYLAFGYKKNAAAYYKAFMITLVVDQAIFCYWQLLGVISPEIVRASLVAILNIVPLIMLTILATGKDMGKKKSFIVVGILIACRIGILTLDIIAMTGIYRHVSSIILYRIGDLLLAGTAAFMIAGKYLDKASRGSK